MEHVAHINFFSKSSSYGTVIYREQEVHLHKNILQQLTCRYGDWIICEIELQSTKNSAGLQVIKARHLGADYEFFKRNLEMFTNAERRGIYAKLPSFFQKLADEYFLGFDFLETVLYMVNKYVDSFKIDEIIDTISGEVQASGYWRPGKDDRFSARIHIKPSKSNDPYITSKMPFYIEETYSDKGFYPCYLMEEDYNKNHRKLDEARVPELVEKFKFNYAKAYNAIAHKELLVGLRITALKDAIVLKLISDGNVNKLDILNFIMK